VLLNSSVKATNLSQLGGYLLSVFERANDYVTKSSLTTTSVSLQYLKILYRSVL